MSPATCRPASSRRDLDVVDCEPSGEPRRPGRRRTARRAPRPASSSSASTWPSSTSACTPRSSTSRTIARGRRSHAVARARDRHGAQALDTVIVSGTASPADVLSALDLADEPRRALARPALRDDRRPAACGRHRRRASRGHALRSPRRGAREPPRGDGRLLRLGEGRRLSDSAVGDLPRPGGARRARRRARARADDLPRPRRQRRPRRRPHARGDPRPAAGHAAGPVEADRAGRDDLLQVRPPRPRAPQSRGGARRDAALRLPGRRARERAGGRGASSSPTLGERARGLPRPRLGRRGVRAVLPQLHAGRRACAARARLAPRAPARRRDFLGGAASDSLGLRVDAEPLPPAGLVRLRHGLRRARRPPRRCGASTAIGRSSARSSRTSR